MRSFMITLGALGTAFVLGAVLFNFIIMPKIVRHGSNVAVPRLLGLSMESAAKQCRQVGLKLQVADRRYSEGVPPDRVLEQSPSPNTAVKRSRTVRVHVSLGTQAVVVPELRGMTLRQARLQLENAQLNVGRIARVHSGNQGQVVRATRPAAGNPTSSGNSVDILVAEGEDPQPFLMPNFAGRSLDEVRDLIKSGGFRSRVTYRTKRGVYPGTILEHYPPTGSLILRGESIDLVASTPR